MCLPSLWRLFGKTICYFVIIYLVVVVMNIVVVARSRLIRLLVAERVQETIHLKNPAVSFFLFLAACGMLLSRTTM